jgi:hypothetical protein
VKLRPEDWITGVIVIAVLLLLMLLSACVNVSQQCEASSVVGDSRSSCSADGVRPQVLDGDTIPVEPALL